MSQSADPKIPDEEQARPSRRAILRGIPAAGVTLGALAAGTEAQAAPEADAVPDNESGYAENDHVRRYYQLSRF